MTPEDMLSADGSPFEDQDTAAMKRDMLARAFGEAFQLVGASRRRMGGGVRRGPRAPGGL